MNDEEQKIIKAFEGHARSPDKVPYIMAREQIKVMELIRKDLEKLRKEIVQLRADIKQENRKKLDDGK